MANIATIPHVLCGIAAATWVALLVALPARAAEVAVSEFHHHGLEGWSERSFHGETRYRLIEAQGRRVLDAQASASASGLYRKLAVDLKVAPYLAWRWWIECPVPVDDVRVKAGDDFAARVYVVFSGGLRFWTTTTLVYVWAEADAPSEPWLNPFTGQAAMIAVRRGGGGRWQSEHRNLAADYRRAFGAPPPPVVAVAIMTDTDQTGYRAHARYADLRFTQEPAG